MRSSRWIHLGPLLALVILLTALSAFLLLFPPSEYGHANDGSETILINPWRGSCYPLIMLTSAIAVFYSLWLIGRKQRVGWGLLPFAIASPLFCCGSLLDELPAHHDVGSVRDQDGVEYHFLRSHFLQGSHLAIGRLLPKGGFYQEFKILVTSPWEESFGYLAVVRPETKAFDHKLFLTEKHVLVGIPHENMAYLAYDLKSKKAYSQIFSGNGKGYVDIRQLSPFLLLNEHDTPRKSDLRRLFSPSSTGRPVANAVKPELTNPNPEVAKLARKLLADLKAHPPQL